MELTPVQQKFVVHWGEMGTRWGVNRSIAQIHALLYLSPDPLPAETIAEVLGVARSNVSGALKELQNWGIVRVVHRLGDRRDHYETLKDVWEMFQIILDERKRREVDPTMRLLRECVEEAERAGEAERETKQRLEAMLEFLETMSRWYDQIRALPHGAVLRLVKMGRKVRQVLTEEQGRGRPRG